MAKCANEDCTNQARVKYCSRSCSAIVNNRIPKRGKEGKCKVCQLPIHSGYTYCKDCYAIKVSNPPKERDGEHYREYMASYVKSYKRRLKEKAVEYLGGKCVDCGYSRCIDALEFHHRDPSQKDFHFSRVTRSFENIKAELDKCDLICANCHRERHYGQPRQGRPRN